MAAPRFHKLMIGSIRRETSEAIVITFEVPEALKAAYAFIPGQYVTLRAKLDGEDLRRSYSICSKPLDDGLSIGIKGIAGGRFSVFAMGLKIGDELDVMTPEGRFLAPVGGEHRYLLLAAGSGITPMMSIAKSTLAGEAKSQVALLYANRTSDSIMFGDELHALKDRYMTRFVLAHVLDEEVQDIELLNGRLDREKLEAFAASGVIMPERYDGVYVCGPQPMIEEASAVMGELGVAPGKIHFELFTPPGGPPPTASASADVRRAVERGASVEVILDGSRRRFRIENADDTVLKAATRAGLELPFSCAGGMCCTCRCKVVEGKSEMILNYSLQPWELDAGFTLACQTRPTSEHLVLDFDAT
ncbi:MAG: 2Fe-2S iron-sulfur cluster-binding protein [Geminicoccaceae bacterium]